MLLFEFFPLFVALVGVVAAVFLFMKDRRARAANEPDRRATYAHPHRTSVPVGQHGIFDKVDDAVSAATEAQKKLVRLSLEDRSAIVNLIKSMAKANAQAWGKMELDETKIGRLDHKVEKLQILELVPGVEFLRTNATSGSNGVCLEEFAPFGVIGIITPVTHSVPPRGSNMARARSQNRTVPVKLAFSSFCVRSRSASRSAWVPNSPAVTTTASIGPSACAAAVSAGLNVSGDSRSHTAVPATDGRPPRMSRSPALRLRSSVLRPSRNNRSPRSASWRAIARPIPLVPPSTSTFTGDPPSTESTARCGFPRTDPTAGVRR